MKARRKLISKKQKAYSRDEAKRFATNVSKALVAIAAVVGVVIVANRWGVREGMQEVRILGRSVLDSIEIMERAAIAAGVPIRKLDLDSIETRIESHPFISSASVYRGENGTLVVEIAERAPVAMTFVEGAPIYIDSAGVALPYRFSRNGFDVPVLSGVEEEDIATRLTGSGIDSANTIEALGVAETIRRFDETLYRSISEIRRQMNGEYVLYAADGGVPVKAGKPADIAGRLRKLDLFLSTVLVRKGAERAEYIDIRWHGEVVVKWREREGQREGRTT